MFPAVPDLVCQVRQLTRSPKPGATFRILLATLEHDADGRQTRHVGNALRGQTAFEVVQTCRVLRVQTGDTRSESEGQKRGHAWLEADQADVLIWGDVAKSDETLRLRFLRREGSTLKPEARSSYTLEKTELPKAFGKDFAIQLVALALSSIQPVTEQAGTYLVAAMRPVAARLDALRAHPPAFFTPLQKAALHHSFALAAQTIGKQAGETRWLEEAVQAYRAALEERTRERVPLDWAGTQNNLGTALRRLGERESGTARLEEAAVAYRPYSRTSSSAPNRAAHGNPQGFDVAQLGHCGDGPLEPETQKV